MFARFLSCLALALGVAIAEPAQAYHRPGEEWVNNTAYTLRAGELSLGLFQFQAGVLDEVMLGTFPALWAASHSSNTPSPTATSSSGIGCMAQ